jgi:hypothetical protein
MNSEMLNIVTVILAIGSFLQPMFFGTIFLFMFKWFPTRKEIELTEANQIVRHNENALRFQTIEDDVKTLLRRGS